MDVDAVALSLGCDRSLREETLGLVATMRRQLDEIEADVVRSARRSGESWREIGTALGVTPQAARLRFGARLTR